MVRDLQLVEVVSETPHLSNFLPQYHIIPYLSCVVTGEYHGPNLRHTKRFIAFKERSKVLANLLGDIGRGR